MRMSSGVEKLLPFDRLNINEFVHSELNLGSRWDIYGKGVLIHIKFGQDV